MASVDFIKRPSNELKTRLNLAADDKFDWSAHQLSKNLSVGHWTNDLTTSESCDS